MRRLSWLGGALVAAGGAFSQGLDVTALVHAVHSPGGLLVIVGTLLCMAGESITKRKVA